MSTDPMTLHVTFNNLQRDLEALEARHLDLARRYDALLAQDRAERHACREQFSIIDLPSDFSAHVTWCGNG